MPRPVNRLLFCLALVVVMTACHGSPSQPGPALTAMQGSMSATVDGAQFTAANVKATQASGIVLIQGSGTASGGTLILSITLPATARTYGLGPVPGAGTQSVTLTVGNGGQIWSADIVSGTGMVTLATVSATSATGTFSVSLDPILLTGASGTRAVTSGAFSVTF